METFVQEGKVLRMTAPYTVAAGAGAQIGAVFGVAQNDVASGALGEFRTQGVFDLAKTTGAAWTEGQLIFWDNTNKKCITTAKGNIPIGYAVKNETDALPGSAATVGRVRLAPPTEVAFQHTTVGAADTVVTGLSFVISAVVSLDADPVDDPFMVTCTTGDQAGAPAPGSIIVKTWRNTGGTDPTPLAATTFSKKVNVLAIGY